MRDRAGNLFDPTHKPSVALGLNDGVVTLLHAEHQINAPRESQGKESARPMKHFPRLRAACAPAARRHPHDDAVKIGRVFYECDHMQAASSLELRRWSRVMLD